jgi:hypothetical protein
MFKLKREILIFLFLAGCFSNVDNLKNTHTQSIRNKIQAIDNDLNSELDKFKKNESSKQITKEENNLLKGELPQKNEEKNSISSISPVKITSKNSEFLEFETEGFGESTKYERIIDAEKRAEDDALSKIIKEAGVNVYYGFFNILSESNSNTYEFIAKYTNVWSNALVSYERISTPNCFFDGNLNRCSLKIKGRVYLKGDPDPNFELKASLDKPSYFEGDEIKIKVKVSKDSYLTILNYDEEGNVSVIFPNRYYKNKIIKSFDELIIPSDEMGFKLKTYIKDDRPQTTEIIHIIATKTQPLILDLQLEEKKEGNFIVYPLGKIKQIAEKLAKFPRSEWTSQVILYKVVKRN